MKTNVERALRLVCVMAALAAPLLAASCGNDSPSQPGLYYVTSPSPYDNRDFSYSLGPLTIYLRLYAGDYTDGDVSVQQGHNLCATRRLTADSGKFTMRNTDYGGCDSFTLNLQYVAASGPCQPGGLYLLTGSVTDPVSKQTVEYAAMNLATWDQQGEAAEAWITPFDAPSLLSQAAQYDYLPGGPFDTLGRWTYRFDYRSSVVPPAGCSMRTTVDLTLTPVDESLRPRSYRYLITETNSGGHLAFGGFSTAKGAPTVSMALDESAWPVVTRRLSFAGMDLLRDAKALPTVAFAQAGRTVSFWDPLRPFAIHGDPLDITQGYPVAPLATHLARFFSGVTAPLTNSYPPSSIGPLIPVRMNVGLATPMAEGTVVVPLLLVPESPLKPGFDDRADCAAMANRGLCCTLAAAIKAAMVPISPPNPLAWYTLDITFGGAQPVLRVQQAVIPLANVSE